MFRSALTIIREYVQLHGEVTEKMNAWETMFIQKYHGLGKLVAEQQKPDDNPLYDLFTFTDTSEIAEQ